MTDSSATKQPVSDGESAAGERFEPTIAQALFGQPHKQYAVPPIMESALRYIRDELDRIMWNIHQKDFPSPFSNTAAAFKELPEFQVEAYSWDEDYEQPWNFKCGDLEISWYKYLGRGMSANQQITPDVAASTLRTCLEALERYESAPAVKPDTAKNEGRG